MTDDCDESDDGASHDELVAISLEISIAGEKVQFTVNLPRGPASWEHLLPFMRSLIAVGSDISQEYFAKQDRPVSCRAGCGMCCRQRVPIAEFEAHRLRRLIESMPEPRRSEIIARFESAEARVAAAGDAVRYDRAASGIKELVRRSANYFRLMIPCPFLENESCSIYEERPLKCREYLVTSPAEFCANPDTDAQHIQPLPLPLAVYLTTLSLREDVSEDPEETPYSNMRWVPLDQLLTWTDSHEPPAATRTGPDRLHELMTKLSQPKV